MKRTLLIAILLIMAISQVSHAIMERGEYPWEVNLRSWHDREIKEKYKDVTHWFLNLGPTGIRARIYPNKANLFVVKYVFKDSPASGKIQIEDVIAGANGKPFKTKHRFGRRLSGGGGWDGPMMELAGHLEDSQGKDGVLNLTVWPKGDKKKQKIVPIQLRAVGRFSPTFPFNCQRSQKMLEELCDFMIDDYKSSNWKSANSFYGAAHGRAHQMLAIMASGISKYDSIIKKEMSKYSGKKYDPASGGFQCWNWGFDGILMGEYYLLNKDKKLERPMKSLAECMPWGSFMQNGVYTHRSHINIRKLGRKPYASIAAISGLQMIAMSLFQVAGLPYDTQLHETIHQLYLGSTSADAVNIAYAFGGQGEGSNGRDARHAIIKLKNPSLGKSGKGPGYLCPTGMKGITDYTIQWPTKKDPRWKPLDWLKKEADENTVEELEGDIRRVDRYLGPPVRHKEPTRPYNTKKSGGHLAPVGMGALAHLIGNDDKPSWEYLGRHAANTCVLGPNNAFDGHAASNLHAFWSVLGAARSDDPDKLRKYFDYMKTFLILSECHDGGLYLQPWGRDRPGCNSDGSYGPRLLPTATGAILLALPKKRLQITGAGGKGVTPRASTSSSSSPSSSFSPPSVSRSSTSTLSKKPSPTLSKSTRPSASSKSGLSIPKFMQDVPPPAGTTKPVARQARTMSRKNARALDRALLNALVKMSDAGKLQSPPMPLSVSRSKVSLVGVSSDGTLAFKTAGGKEATHAWRDLQLGDTANMAVLLSRLKPESRDAMAMAGVYLERLGRVSDADRYYSKAGPASSKKLQSMFD